MDADISVACRREATGWVCDVRVAEGDSSTQHEVSVTNDEMTRYSPESADVEALVERSFRFLLAREPKESILRRFGLSDIERYFPEFREWAQR